MQPCLSACGVQVWSTLCCSMANVKVTRGFMPIDGKWWKTSTRTWPRGRRSRLTSCGGSHVGHALARGHGRVDCVRRCGQGLMGHVSKIWGHACGALLATVSWLSLKTTYMLVLLNLDLKTRWWRFRQESEATRDIITKGVSRRSNFV